MRRHVLALILPAAMSAVWTVATADEPPLARPYIFAAGKAEDGTLTLTGHMPDAATRDEVVGRAAGLAGGGAVVNLLELASGAPDRDWQRMAETALASLGPLLHGSARLDDTAGRVEGAAPGVEALAAALAALAAAPEVDWQTDLRLALGADAPFVLEAERPADGPLTLAGHVPDAAARERLAAIAARIGGMAPEVTLLVTEPPPPPDWVETAAAALEMLGRLPTGRLEIRGPRVTLTGDVATDPDAAELRQAAPEGWELVLAVLEPDPPAGVTITIPVEGNASATGILPRGMERRALGDAVPGLDASEVSGGGAGDESAWEKALIGVAAVTPRLRHASVTITGTEIAVAGRLRRGFNAEEARSALRGAAGPEWRVSFDVSEAMPGAVLALVLSEGRTDVAGILPAGLAPEEVVAAYGIGGGFNDTLSADGEGDPTRWRAGIAALARVLPLFSALEAKLIAERFEARGTLLPGYGAADLEALLAEAEAAGWQPALDLAETPPADGDTRLSLTTGETETWRNGFWLPEVGIDDPSPRKCSARARQVLAQSHIAFVTGSAEIAPDAGPVLDRLAAIVLACLDTGAAGRLIVGGHTDDRGGRRANLALSRERAEAVVAALAARGISPGAMVAIGYGMFEPVADNTSREGRAKNRRITFAFIE